MAYAVEKVLSRQYPLAFQQFKARGVTARDSLPSPLQRKQRRWLASFEEITRNIYISPTYDFIMFFMFFSVFLHLPLLVANCKHVASLVCTLAIGSVCARVVVPCVIRVDRRSKGGMKSRMTISVIEARGTSSTSARRKWKLVPIERDENLFACGISANWGQS